MNVYIQCLVVYYTVQNIYGWFPEAHVALLL